MVQQIIVGRMMKSVVESYLRSFVEDVKSIEETRNVDHHQLLVNRILVMTVT